MNNELSGKKRWIFKFNFLCKQRLLIFRILTSLIFTIILAFIIICFINLKNIFYVLPSLFLPAAISYPHAINKRRMEQLYVDLPKEIKPTYENFVKKYAKYLLIVQFINKKIFKSDIDKIIELINNHNEQNKTQ